MRTTLILLLALLPQLGLAQAACEYTLTHGQITALVFDELQVVPGNITLRRQDFSPPGLCARYRLYYNKGQSQSYQRLASLNGRTIQYNLHQNINMTGILKDQTDATSAVEYIEISAPERNVTYMEQFYVSIPGLSTQGIPPKGTYNDIVQVKVGSLRGPNWTLTETLNLSVSLIVPPRLSISLVDEGGPFNASSTSKVLDFGNLSLNQERGVDLRVLSNTSYEIRVSSQNNGKLRQGAQSSVNYLFFANGSPFALTTSGTSPVRIGTGTGTSGSSGDRFNLRIRIAEETSAKTAGDYSDVITITAIAN